jgi:hypothetical protein
MWGILIPLLIGVAVGYFSPGHQDKSRMFMRGLLWAVVIAVVVAAIGWITNTDPLTMAGLGGSYVGLVLSFVIALVIFLVGVWVGDWLEGRRTRRAQPPATRPPTV